MPDAFERKLEVENKLENELNSLNLLKERAAKSSQLTSSMVGILDSFELRLARLEETILPVYNETGNLQRQQENIERTLTALDTVIGFYGVSAEVEATVRAGPGPTSTGGAGLDAFLRAMARLAAAQQHFEKNNPQSVELENVTTLCTAGGDALNREFKELLFKHSKPMSPAALLDLVAVDDAEDTPSSLLPRFPAEVGAELSRLADWLERNGRDEFMNVFARVRATALLKAMTQLRDHQRSASGGSQHNVGAGSSPMPRAKFQNRHEASSKRTTRRLAHVFEKQANKMLMKASQTLEQSTGLSLGSRRTAFPEGREDAVDDQEMETYLEGVLALQRLMMGERRLMDGIIPAQHQHQIFQIVVKDAMDLVVQDGESIAARAKRSIARHDFAAVLVVFPILKHLQLMKPEFDRTVDGCDAAVKSKFSSILVTLHATGAKGLEDFIESVRSDPVSQLPRDGTVHEQTSNALVFLEQLLDYADVIAGVLAQDPAYAGPTSHSALLGLYIKKVLSQLNLTLLTKSEAYGDVHLRALFRLNNNNYVLKALQRSGLMDVLRQAEPAAEDNYHAMILEHKKAYSNSWSKVLSHICAADDPGVAAALAQGKLRDKERAIIKERFAGFNRELDELLRVQRGYCVPDAALRESLKRDNKDFVLPKYSAFRDRHAALPFSKNPAKYVRHSPADVGALIDRFFDVAA